MTDTATHSPVTTSHTRSRPSHRPRSVESEHLQLPLRDDDKCLQPGLLLCALPDRLPVVLAPDEAFLRPRCSEQREFLLRHVCPAVTHVVLLLLANDGVRETVGESDRGDVMIRRGAVALILLRTTS